LKFKPVDNTFNTDDRAYIESLVQFALPVVLVALILLITTWYCLCKKQRRDEYSLDPTTVRRKYANRKVMCCGVIIVALIPVGFIGEDRVATGISQMQTEITSAQGSFNNIIALSADLNRGAAGIVDSVQLLGLPDGSTDSFVASLEAVSAASETVVGLKDFFDTAAAAEFLTSFENYRAGATLGIYVVLLSLACLIFLTAFFHGACLRKAIKGVTPIIAFLSMVLVGAYFAVSVGMADFCTDPNTAVAGIISPGDDSVSQCVEPDDTACVASYYINCPFGEASPFTADAIAAESALQQGLTELRALEEEAGEDFESIALQLGGLSATVQQLAEGVECTALHASYVSGITSVCNSCLSGIVIMMGISAACAIAFSCGVVMISRVPVVDGASEAYDHQRGRSKGNRDTDPLVDTSYADSFCVYKEGSGYGGTDDNSQICSAPKANGCEFCEDHSCSFVVRYTSLQKRCNRPKPWRQQFCERHSVKK